MHFNLKKISKGLVYFKHWKQTFVLGYEKTVTIIALQIIC